MPGAGAQARPKAFARLFSSSSASEVGMESSAPSLEAARANSGSGARVRSMMSPIVGRVVGGAEMGAPLTDIVLVLCVTLFGDT